jgi:hypothetical protein
MALVLLALLVADQLRTVFRFSRYWANEDHTLLWYAAKELARGHIHQPNFYGQSYGTVFAALPQVALGLFAVRPNTGIALGGAGLMAGCWVALSVGAWLRGHRALALLALAIPVVLTNEYGLWGSMQARAPGSFLVALGVAVLIARPESTRALFAFCVLGGLGLLWDNGSVFLLTPAATYAVLVHWRSWRALITAALGVIPAAAWLLASQLFYRLNPDYDFHGVGSSSLPAPAYLWTVITHIDRYAQPLAPELLPWPAIPVVVVTGVVAVLFLTKRLQSVVPAAVALAVTLLTLATPKALDGSSSAFLSYGRLVYSVVTMTWFLGVLIAESGVLRSSGDKFRGLRATGTAATVAMVIAAFITFVVRGSTFDARFGQIAAVAKVSTAPIVEVKQIDDRCTVLRQAAMQEGADLIVMSLDRTDAYACAVEPGSGMATLFPVYERRTWRLTEESHAIRSRILVTDVDDPWCRAADRVYTCRMKAGVPRVAVVDFPPQPVVPVLRKLGMSVRAFDAAR